MHNGSMRLFSFTTPYYSSELRKWPKCYKTCNLPIILLFLYDLDRWRQHRLGSRIVVCDINERFKLSLHALRFYLNLFFFQQKKIIVYHNKISCEQLNELNYNLIYLIFFIAPIEITNNSYFLYSNIVGFTHA